MPPPASANDADGPSSARLAVRLPRDRGGEQGERRDAADDNRGDVVDPAPRPRAATNLRDGDASDERVEP